MKTFMIVSIAVVACIGGYITYGVLTSRPLSPRQVVANNYQGLDIELIYCSPFKKDRLIFGDSAAGALVPYGKYWRLGANEATEITFNKDVTFMGNPVKAGSYRMYAVPTDTVWTISLNSELGKWGFDEPNYELDVVKVNVPVVPSSTVTEQFKISFAEASMNIDWDKVHLSVPIQVQ